MEVVWFLIIFLKESFLGILGEGVVGWGSWVVLKFVILRGCL